MNGDDIYAAVEYPPEFKRGVQKYLQPKEFLKRGFWPVGSDQGPEPKILDRRSQAKMLGSVADPAEGVHMDAPTMDPMPAMALTRLKGLKAMRQLIKKDTQSMLKSGKYPKQAVLAGHRVRLADAKAAATDIPETMWKRVESIIEETGETAGAHRRRSTVDPGIREIDIGLNPATFDYKTVIHEMLGHEGSAALRQGFTRPGAPEPLKRFGSWWGYTKHEMSSMQATLEKADLTIEAQRLYQWNPDELYANAVATAMNRGKPLVEAKKAAAMEMFGRRKEIMFNVRRGLESVRELAAAKGVDLDIDYYLKQYYKQ